jgi:uncharacterized glyoxalase superfamily protein PhnB
MRDNRSMPASMVIPVLAYGDVAEAVRWLGEAFGFSLRLKIGNHRAQLNAGDGAVVVAAAPEGAPAPAGCSIMVRVAGVDAHYERAKRAGARVSGPPETFPYGERQYSAADFAGHRWTFSETVADIDPQDWGGELA